MRVLCRTARGADLPDLYLDPVGGYGPEARFPLLVGKQYLVIALIVRERGVWYYVLDETGRRYPVWYPAPLFDVTDARVSRYWTFGCTNLGLRSGSALFAYTEWSSRPAEYYDRLSDEEPDALLMFEKYHEIMELEFRDSDVRPVAEELEGGWLLCPTCMDAWLSNLRGEMVRCPSCRTVLLNPALASR